MRRSPVLVLSFLVGAQPVAAGVIRGQVVDAHGSPVSDAAVHVMSAGGEAWTTRTAPSGRFFVSLPPGSYRVVVSSTDGTTDHDEVVVHHDSLEGAPDEVVVELATTATPSPATGFDSVDFSGRATLDNFTLDEWEPIAPRLVAPPGARPSSRLLARRDHLGLAALDARLDARRLRTTIGGGARLPGSPGIPVEFLAEPSFVRAAPTISAPSGLGGTAPLAIRFADQRRHGDARASLGPHGRVAAVAAEALEPGELAMTFGGVVERRPAADGAGGPSFVGQALWATELNVEQTRGHLIGLLGGSADGGEDYWGRTRVGPIMAAPACPVCSMEDVLVHAARLECSTCGHEWPRTDAEAEPAEVARVVKDAVGNVLADGDSVTLIKDLKLRGSSEVLKQGTKVRSIRLVDGDHEIDCRIDGSAMALKACFVRKA
jgi:protein PhnA